jgi:hypothetical protein
MLQASLYCLLMLAAAAAPLQAAGPVVNNGRIDGCWFDTATNTISVAWSVPAVSDSLEYLVSWEVGNSAWSLADTAKFPVHSLTKTSDTARISLADDIVFDTVYAVGIWLRAAGGMWALPADSSSARVYTRQFTWQRIIRFPSDTATVFAFNKNVVLRPGNSYIGPIADTVRCFLPAPGLCKGFVPVSTGVYFSEVVASPPFHVGLRLVPGSFPPGYGERNVRMYQEIAGAWSVCREYTLDTAKGIVSVLAGPAMQQYPFILMIDTIHPMVTVQSDTSTPVEEHIALTLKFSLRDNVSNVKVQMLYGRGGDALKKDSAVMIDANLDTNRTITFVLPAAMVSGDAGVRAIIVVDDGVFFDTLDVSPRVVTDPAASFMTNAMQWAPLHVEADLDYPALARVLSGLSTNSVWSYDTNMFRVIRFCANKWLEYSEATADSFSLVPGRLLWIKTGEQTLITAGRGTTPSLKQHCRIPCGASSWTDWAVPFRFDVRIGDILAASGPQADSMEFYQWKKDKTGRWISDPVYLSQIPGLDDPSTAMVSGTFDVYTLFNPGGRTMLNVPPKAAGISLPKKSAGRNASPAWSIAFVPRLENGESLSPVYCGFTQKQMPVKYYAVPPSFGGASVRVADRSHSLTYGHAAFHYGEGAVFDLAFCNDDGTDHDISCRWDVAGSMPEGVTLRFFDTETSSWKKLEGDMRVSVAKQSQTFRTFAVGNDSFYKTDRARNAQQPVSIGSLIGGGRGIVFVKVRSALDPGSAVEVRIINPCGQVVWKESAAGADLLTGGIVWNGTTIAGRPVSGGIYVGQVLTVSDKNGRSVIAQKRLPYCR